MSVQTIEWADKCWRTTFRVGRPAPLERLPLDGVTSPTAAAIDFETGHVAIGESDGTIRGYDKGGKALFCIRTPMQPISQMGFASGGQRLAVADETDTVRLYDWTGRLELALKASNSRIAETAFSGDGLFLGGVSGAHASRHLAIWELASGREVRWRPEEPYDGGSWFITISRTGRLFATGDQGSADLCLREVGTGKLVQRCFTGEPVDQAVFSPDGTIIAASGVGGSLTLWDVKTGQLLPVSADPIVNIRQIRFSTVRNQVIGLADRFRAWDIATSHEIPRFSGIRQRFPYSTLILSPDEKLIATDGPNGSVRLLDSSTGKEQRTLGSNAGIAEALCFTADSRQIISAGYDKTIRIWNLSDGREMYRLSGPTAYRIAVSLEGRRLAWVGYASSGKYEAQVCDMTVMRELQRFPLPDLVPFDPSLTPFGEFLAAGGKVWHVGTGKQWCAQGWPPNATYVCFAPDGRMVAVGGEDGTLVSVRSRGVLGVAAK